MMGIINTLTTNKRLRYNICRLFPIGILFLTTILFFYKVLFPPKLLAGTDIIQLVFCHKYFMVEMFSKGILPLWNPFILGGMPFGPSLGIFYPLNIVYFLFPIESSISFLHALHFFLSGLFMYSFLRYLRIDQFSALIAGIVYSFNGFMIFQTADGHPSLVFALPWIPLIFLFIEKYMNEGHLRYSLLGGIVLGIQALGGHPQIIFYTIIILFFYFLFCIIRIYQNKTSDFFRQIIKLFSFFPLLLIVGLGLAAIQLIPAIELTKYSTRADGVSYNFAVKDSFPPENLMTLIVPGFFGDGLNLPYWGEGHPYELGGYIGLFALILVLITIIFIRRNRHLHFFSLLMFLSLILSFGGYLPLYKFIYSSIPCLNFFKTSARLLLIWTLSASVLTGFGISFLLNKTNTMRLIKFWKILTLLIFVFGLFVFIFNSLNIDTLWIKFIKTGFHSENRLLSVSNLPVAFFKDTLTFARLSLFKTLILLSFAGLILFFIIKSNHILFSRILIFMFIIIDLWIFGAKYIHPVEKQRCYLNDSVVKFLQSDTECYRIVTGIDDDWLNKGMVYGISQADGYDSWVLKRYTEIINVNENRPIDTFLIAVRISRYSKLLDLLNVKYLILKRQWKVDSPTLELVYEDEAVCIYKNLRYIPRAFIVHDFEIIKKKKDILKKLADKDFDPEKKVILEENIDLK